MKKTLLFSLSVLFAFNLFTQNKANVNPVVKSLKAQKPYRLQKDPLPSQGSILQLPEKQWFADEQIGETQYDLQSNASVDSRVYAYPDGTVGATWTCGQQPTTFPNRGTGYNYYNGSIWDLGFCPIETIRTGWPSYSYLGAGGEVVVSHSSTALYMCSRATKGTGIWVETNLPYPATTSPTWPRMVTIGNTMHILAADYNSLTAPYNGQLGALLYWRSTDGGVTFDINGIQIPEIDGTQYPEGFGGDVYSWAEPQGNTLAFVLGDNWSDLILMKSTDGGDNWTKTVIYQHPYPNFNEATSLVPDSPYVFVSDGCHAVALDASGSAHVVFGIMRVSNNDTTDGQTSFFPATDGIAYWKEGDPAFTQLHPDSVYSSGKLIGWTLDLDSSGTLWDGYSSQTDFALYYISQTSMPQITINGNNDIFVAFKMSVENMQATNGQFYNHIWARSLPYGAPDWTDFAELTSGVDYEGVECVFPAMARNIVNNTIWISYQYDMEPGLAVRGDEDQFSANYYMMMSMDEPYIMNVNETIPVNGILNLYPNPVADVFNVNFAINKDANITMKIYNSIGSLVKTENLKVTKGATIEVNISDLPDGIYLTRFDSPTVTFTSKICKN